MHDFELMPGLLTSSSAFASSPFATLQTTPYKYTWNAATYGGNGSATAYGPIGDGPYYYHGYDTVANTGTLVKWRGYWNASGLQALGEFNAQVVHVTWIAAKDQALAAFTNGQLNFLDSNYQLNPADFKVLGANGGKVTGRSSPSAGWQDFVVQGTHPIFGTGVATPNGQKDPAHAARYARDVRAAFSHMIPRQYIITNLLQGIGSIGITEFCTCFAFAYPSDVQPDSFDLTLASQLLAAAGYTTQVGQVAIPPPPSVTCGTSPGTPGAGVVVPSFIQGNTLTLAGTFGLTQARATAAGGTSGFYATMEESIDRGTTWNPVLLTSTTSSGYYSFSYTPTVTGEAWYRVFFTGIPATSNLGNTGPTSPAAAEAYAPPQAPGNGNKVLNTTNTIYSTVTKLDIGTLAQVISAAVSSLGATDAVAVYTASCNVAASTNTAIKDLASSTTNAITTLQSSAASKTDLANAVNTINGSITNVSYISYAALAVAIILGLIAIRMGRRKSS
jgi:hypothetical protein